MKHQNLKRFVTWKTDRIVGAMTYEDARADAALRVKDGKAYILEVIDVVHPAPPQVHIVPFKEGL